MKRANDCLKSPVQLGIYTQFSLKFNTRIKTSIFITYYKSMTSKIIKTMARQLLFKFLNLSEIALMG